MIKGDAQVHPCYLRNSKMILLNNFLVRTISSLASFSSKFIIKSLKPALTKAYIQGNIRQSWMVGYHSKSDSSYCQEEVESLN